MLAMTITLLAMTITLLAMTRGVENQIIICISDAMKTYQRIIFGVIMFFFIVLLTAYTTYGLQDIFPQVTTSLRIYQIRGV